MGADQGRSETAGSRPPDGVAARDDTGPPGTDRGSSADDDRSWSRDPRAQATWLLDLGLRRFDTHPESVEGYFRMAGEWAQKPPIWLAARAELGLAAISARRGADRLTVERLEAALGHLRDAGIRAPHEPPTRADGAPGPGDTGPEMAKDPRWIRGDLLRIFADGSKGDLGGVREAIDSQLERLDHDDGRRPELLLLKGLAYELAAVRGLEQRPGLALKQAKESEGAYLAARASGMDQPTMNEHLMRAYGVAAQAVIAAASREGTTGWMEADGWIGGAERLQRSLGDRPSFELELARLMREAAAGSRVRVSDFAVAALELARREPREGLDGELDWLRLQLDTRRLLGAVVMARHGGLSRLRRPSLDPG